MYWLSKSLKQKWNDYFLVSNSYSVEDNECNEHFSSSLACFIYSMWARQSSPETQPWLLCHLWHRCSNKRSSLISPLPQYITPFTGGCVWVRAHVCVCVCGPLWFVSEHKTPGTSTHTSTHTRESTKSGNKPARPLQSHPWGPCQQSSTGSWWHQDVSVQAL